MNTTPNGANNETSQTPNTNPKAYSYANMLFIIVVIGAFVLSGILIYKLFTIPPTPDSQFDRLMGVLTFFFTIFGIVIPVAAYLIQQRSLKEERIQMLKDVRKEKRALEAFVKTSYNTTKREQDRICEEMKKTEKAMTEMQKDAKSELVFQMGFVFFNFADIARQELAKNDVHRYNANNTSLRPGLLINVFAVQDAGLSFSLLRYCYLAIKNLNDCIKLDRLEKKDADVYIKSCLPLLTAIKTKELVSKYDYMLDPLKNWVAELLAIPQCVSDPNLKQIHDIIQDAIRKKGG